ncbi:Hypothetical Protein FCC1311_087862 [Hondaea fermentalgiana]|uniref:Uncharacterized protein n=1 Tax=Hondaea fermentalgiana TaxID=2315210 RepID=A0A2R5GNU3_9STRA|nr:Hypothetical Protein FCC1311_087862 [Hondaea fermentalgiana]|eukprot:GBG32562.1 Hypothetical Protein FCC1311_087862 [Hondaea fermentalgiana]
MDGAALVASVDAAFAKHNGAFPFALSASDCAEVGAKDFTQDLRIWGERTRPVTNDIASAERLVILEKLLKKHAKVLAAEGTEKLNAQLLSASWLAQVHGEWLMRRALCLNARDDHSRSLQGTASELSRRYVRKVLDPAGAGPLAQAAAEHPTLTPESHISLKFFAAQMAGLSPEVSVAAIEDAKASASLAEAIFAHLQDQADAETKRQKAQQRNEREMEEEYDINSKPTRERAQKVEQQLKAKKLYAAKRRRGLLGLAVALALGGDLDAENPATLPADVADVLVDVVATLASLKVRRGRGLGGHALLHGGSSQEEDTMRKVDLTRAANKLEVELSESRRELLEAVAWLAHQADPSSQ